MFFTHNKRIPILTKTEEKEPNGIAKLMPLIWVITISLGEKEVLKLCQMIEVPTGTQGFQNRSTMAEPMENISHRLECHIIMREFQRRELLVGTTGRNQATEFLPIIRIREMWHSLPSFKMIGLHTQTNIMKLCSEMQLKKLDPDHIKMTSNISKMW